MRLERHVIDAAVLEGRGPREISGARAVGALPPRRAHPPVTAARGMVAIRGALRPATETLREPAGPMLSISATAATTRTGIAGLRMTRTLPSVAIARAPTSSAALLVSTSTGSMK